MNKFYLFFGFVLLPFSSFGQITLTSAANLPSVGESYNYIVNSQATLDVSQSGANQVWDLSGLTGASNCISYPTVSTGAVISTFPSSTLIESTMSGITLCENYFLKSSSEYSILGQYVAGYATVDYTADKKEIVKFPITYDDQFSETFAATITTTNYTTQRSGTTEIVADGYGTLILPYGTFHNVLRVLAVSEYTDMYMGVMNLGNFTDSLYFWYDVSNKTHLAYVTTVYQNYSLSKKVAGYLAQSDVVGIEEVSAETLSKQFECYPKSADTFLKLANSGKQANFEIYDLKGQKLIQDKLDEGVTEIDVSSYKSGIYFIKYITESGTYMEKFIVK